MTGRMQCQVRDCPRPASTEIEATTETPTGTRRWLRYTCGLHRDGMSRHLEDKADVIITRPYNPTPEPDQPDQPDQTDLFGDDT